MNARKRRRLREVRASIKRLKERVESHLSGASARMTHYMPKDDEMTIESYRTHLATTVSECDVMLDTIEDALRR